MFNLRGLLAAALVSSFPLTVSAESLSGSYLAAREAEARNDYAVAAQYYTRALVLEPGNPELMEALTLAQLMRGGFEQAVPVARSMEARGIRSQVAHMVMTTELARQGDFDALISRSADDERGIGPLVDGLIGAWAQIGAGNVADGLAAFDDLASQQGLRGFALYHKALALGFAGQYDEATEILSGEGENGIQMTRRGAMARAEMFSQQGDNTAALESLEAAFGAASDPGIDALRARLGAGETVPYTHVTSATDGIAEVYYSIAAALMNEAQADYTLLYARVALSLRADHTDALLLAGELLDDLGQHELAIDTYAAMPRDHVDYHAAELGRAGALRALDKHDAAIEVLNNLARTHGHLAVIYSTLGDIHRQQLDFADAVAAYDAALERTPEDTARGKWFLHYARAIALERQGEWPAAEADFRRALELEPDQPQVLNYLGYSLVEKQIKLDEALEMIERAVAAQPDSGYIVDSLGWVLYRLGRYEEAVGHMERAVELMPVDPVVNDHLGDVYWAVGREREAQFQWSRALSFIDEADNTSEADPDRIRRKMEVGLDIVLAEEGAAPLRVADDN